MFNDGIPVSVASYQETVITSYAQNFIFQVQGLQQPHQVHQVRMAKLAGSNTAIII